VQLPDKVAKWLMFTVLISLAPLLASWIWAAASSSDPVGLYAVVRQGDLCLLAASFCAVGLGELIGIKRSTQTLMIFVGGTSALTIMLSVFLYALVRNATSLPNEGYVVGASVALFVIGVVSSTVCVAISEIKDA
jgi:uncharacterized membrane protein